MNCRCKNRRGICAITDTMNRSADLELERQGLLHYVDAIKYSESVNDYVSHEIFAAILRDTEDHIDYLETQLELIDKTGLQNYLQSAMGSIVD